MIVEYPALPLSSLHFNELVSKVLQKNSQETVGLNEVTTELEWYLVPTARRYSKVIGNIRRPASRLARAGACKSRLLHLRLHWQQPHHDSSARSMQIVSLSQRAPFRYYWLSTFRTPLRAACLFTVWIQRRLAEVDRIVCSLLLIIVQVCAGGRDSEGRWEPIEW
jgi:hypothetical protein